jgi:hypothetical protein
MSSLRGADRRAAAEATSAPAAAIRFLPGHVIATGADGWEAAGRAVAAASLITFAMDEEMACP